MTASHTRFHPLRIFPVALALVFNLVAGPLLPFAQSTFLGPLGQAAQVSAAGDPSAVNFTLEGCRNPSVDLETNNFVCADGDYTTGNLGKTWNELDLVPHRLITQAGNSAPAMQTYTIGIAADSMDAGHPGYDVMSAPVLNTGESDASCTINAGNQQTITPGVGGTDESIGRLLDITQAKNSTCVFDWVERLAVGSHLFPGSSLHTNRTNSQFSTQGIGAADVSIPVKEIAPQELSKTMTATQGQTYTWSIEKSTSPTSLDFANTCATSDGARSAQVQVTISWTRSGPAGSGDTTITTEITATNPALRTITVNVTDKIYAGSDQSTLVDTASSGNVDVAPQSSAVVLTHQFIYSGQATSFNDVATASYTDKVTGVPVTGTTKATASATTQAASGPAANETATITDSESITGTGLAFSVATPSIGSFSNYTAGDSTTGPVKWTYTASGSGSVTFNKTVTVDQPRNTSGTLSDTAKVMEGEDVLDSASASTDITAEASVSLTITKNIPSDSLTGSQSATFTFDISGPDSYSAQRTLTFNAGDSSKSVTITGLAPGTYTVHEEPLAGWAAQTDKQVDLGLPTCSAGATFTNSPEPDVSVQKTTDTPAVFAGQPVHYRIVVSAGGTGTSHNVTLSDTLPALASGSWSYQIVSPDQDDTCSIDAGVLSCSFGDMASGTSKTVNLTATTSTGDCPGMDNTATVSSTDDSNAENNSAGPVHITVTCPNVSIEKTTSTPEVNAGDPVSYSLAVTASGTGDSNHVTLTDTLPAGITWTVGGADAGACSIDSGVLTCDFGTLSPSDSRHITLTGTADMDTCPSIANSASVTADHDVNPSDNTAGPVTITVNCPAIHVTKTADAASVNAGDPIGFTVTVSNSGPGDAYGVNLDDSLPAGSGSGVTWSIDTSEYDHAAFAITGSAGSQSLALAGQPITLGAGDSLKVHITAATSATECSTYDNTASVSTTNDGSDKAEAVITCHPADIAITKVADAASVNAGDEIGFTVTVSNSGSGDAYGVTLSDPLPAGNGGSPVHWVIDTSAFDHAAFAISGSDGSQTLGLVGQPITLGAGDSLKVHITAATGNASCATYDNTASVSTTNDGSDEATAETEVLCPGIHVLKSADAASVNGGQQIGFTVTVLNNGDGAAYGVTLADALPAGNGGSPVHWAIDTGEFDYAAFAITGADGSQTLGLAGQPMTVAAGTTLKVHITAETTRASCATYDNTASVTTSNDGSDEDSASIDVTCPVIEIVKSNNQPNPVLPGTDVTYTLNVAVSDGPANDVTVVDTLPFGLDSPTSISNSGVWSNGTRTITWHFDSLDNGDPAITLSYHAVVSASDTHGQVLTNNVYVTGTNTQCPDTETLDAKCQSQSDVSIRVPTLVIDKAASVDEVHFVFNSDGSVKSVTPDGAQVTWTLTYTLANGPVTNAVISDPLPDYLTFVSAANGGTYDAGTRTVTWQFATLSASGSVSFLTTVDSDAPETGPIVNVASIVSDQTAKDTGEDGVRVTSEQVQAATPTPSVPNTAVLGGQNGQPIQIPIELLVVFFLGSLGALTLANVKAVRRRRR
jgi:uncharacterized repeat protein (TIGR01451 family)